MTLSEAISLLPALAAALAWPALLFGVVFLFRSELRQLLNRLIKVKLLNQEAEFGTIVVNDKKDKPGLREATVAVRNKDFPPDIELSQFQVSILTEFLERGNYDALKVSHNAFPDFKKLKTLGLLRWDQEEHASDGVKVTEFGLTDAGKQRVK